MVGHGQMDHGGRTLYRLGGVAGGSHRPFHDSRQAYTQNEPEKAPDGMQQGIVEARPDLETVGCARPFTIGFLGLVADNDQGPP